MAESEMKREARRGEGRSCRQGQVDGLSIKDYQNSVFGLYFGNRALMVSLNAKLKAWVGKYRMTFTVFPRQKAEKPCSDDTRVKQLTMPV